MIVDLNILYGIILGYLFGISCYYIYLKYENKILKIIRIPKLIIESLKGGIK